VLDLRQPVLDPMFVADAVEDMNEGIAMAFLVGELDAVVGQHGVDGIGNGGDQIAQELRRGHFAGLLVQFGIGKLRRPVDGHEKVQLAFGRLNLGNIDVKVADRIGFELFLGGPVAFGIRQFGNVVPLQTAVQRRARQVRNGRLQRIETIVERQERMLSEGDDDGLFLERQNRRFRLFRAGRKIGNRRSLLPLGNRLLIDPVALRKRS
jgi:hypothetical protein